MNKPSASEQNYQANEIDLQKLYSFLATRKNTFDLKVIKINVLIKKILRLIVIMSGFGFSVAFALSATQAVSLIKENPALLNTPQAQAEMSKRGLIKSDVMNKVDATKSNTVVLDAGTNNIDTSEVTDVSSLAIKAEDIYTNPLAYKSNADMLKTIKAKQNIETATKLERFSKVFFKNKNTLDYGSLPVPDYYVVSHGDIMNIWVYGVTEETFEASVDNYGNVNIPIVGPIGIAGLEFKDAKALIVSKLTTAYSNASIIVNIAKYSTIQVSLTGNVNAPGIYNMSALSTVKDLLIHSGGVKDNGTVRSITLQRGDGSIHAVDLYSLLLGKNDEKNLFLKNGDVVYIPNSHKIVGISGAVNTPAKYELKPGEKLDKLIDFSGGIYAGGSHYGLRVSGFDGEQTQVRTVDASNADTFKLNDRDQIFVYSVGNLQEKSISIYGSVVRPGKRALINNMSLAKLLGDEMDKFGLEGVFLENTLFNFAMIKRKTDSLNQEFVRVDIAKVLSGNTDEQLKAGDELYIFNQLDSSLNPYVKISGTIVAKTGEFQFINGMTVGDLIQVAGLSGPFDENKIKLVTYQTNDLMPKVLILTREQANKTILNAFDEVELYDYYNVNQIAKASINGEVNFAGEYVIHSGMKLSKLISSAGGLTNKAFLDNAEIVRYEVKNGKRVKSIRQVDLSKADNFELQSYDEVTIYRIPNWHDKKTITLTGQVVFPGIYTFNDGDRLSDVLARAGGFNNNAFLYGASFERESVKKIQQQALEDAMVRLKKKLAVINSRPKDIGEGSNNNSNLADTLNVLSEQSKTLTPLGRIAINLPSDIDVLKSGDSDILLKNGDKLHIPVPNDTVMVIGEVMSPTAVIYDNDDVLSYISKVGGMTPIADDDQIYVVHANGEAERFGGGLFLSAQVSIKPGDVIVVPQVLVNSTGMQVAKDISSILYQFAVTAASLKTVGAF